MWPFRKKTDILTGGAPGAEPFQFKSKGVPAQRHRVKVRHVQGFAAREVDQSAVGIQVRSLVLVFALSLLMGTMAVRLAYVAVMPPAEPRASIRELPKEPLRRGDIYDRNGVLLATTLKTYSLYADPKRLLDVNEVIRKLTHILPDLSPTKLRDILDDNTRRFVWLKRRLTPAEAQKIHVLGLPGLGFREEYVRVYPLKNLASHVLGAVDIDNNGLAGVERGQNHKLKRGERIDLTLDARLQDMLAESVQEALTLSEAKAGWGITLDTRTMGILGMVSLPDYDPNRFGAFPDAARFNHAALGSYEMGSTFKIFTLAQGLNDGKITPNTTIDCREPIHIGRFTIKDYHAKKSVLTATEILRYSSNIGAAKIADMSGPAAQKDFLGKLGMLQPMNVGLGEIGPVRYPANWGRIQTFTIAFGHGIMVTPLHLVAAAAALANDGHFRTPSIVQGMEQKPPVKVMEMSAVADVRNLMRDVVLSGSGRNAQVLGYDIGGKTGTAEKISGRGYAHDKNVVSFVAALPMDNPQYVTLIMLDEPKKGFETGGRSAAPAVGKFLRRMGLVEGIAPDMALVNLQRQQLEKRLARVHTPVVPIVNEADANEGESQREAGQVADEPTTDVIDEH